MANQVKMSPDEFMAKRNSKKTESPEEFMERQKVIKSNSIRKGFLEDASKQLKPYALAPLSALTNTIDGFIKGGLHGDDFFSPIIPTISTSDVVDEIRERYPSLKFTNKPQEVVYDVATSLIGMKPKGKTLEYLAKGASKTPGFKTLGNYASKKLKGVSDYTPINTLIHASSAAAPHLVDDDNHSGKFAASMGTGLGIQALTNLFSILNKKVPKDKFDKAGVPKTRADVTQNKLLKFLEKKSDIYPLMGRTADVKNQQRKFLKNDLGIDNSAFNPDDQGYKFYQAAEEALPNIDAKTALRVKLLDNFEKLIGDVDLKETNKTYKKLYEDVKSHPAGKEAFNQDNAVKFIDSLLQPHLDSGADASFNPAYKSVKMPLETLNPVSRKGKIPLKTLNTTEKLMQNTLATSPLGSEFKRALTIDKESAALKKLNKKDLDIYLNAKAEAVDYFENIDSEVKKLKGINKEERNLLATSLFTQKPSETYKTVSVIRSNLTPDSIPEYNKVVTQALGTDKNTLEFSFKTFADNVTKMPKDIKKAFFGENLSNVNEAVSLIKKTGNLDISNPGLSEWKIMKLLTFVGAVPIKGFDFINTWKPAITFARKRQVAKSYYDKNPKEAQKRPNFIKTLSSVLFRPEDDEE